MRTQRFITIVCLLLWTVAHLHAYEKRDLLQKEADFEKVKSALIMEQKWVPYPDYSDRPVGINSSVIIKKSISGKEKVIWIMSGRL